MEASQIWHGTSPGVDGAIQGMTVRRAGALQVTSAVWRACLVKTCGLPQPQFVQCLQYRTQQQTDLKKVDKLNTLFFSLMATGKAPAGVWHGVLEALFVEGDGRVGK